MKLKHPLLWFSIVAAAVIVLIVWSAKRPPKAPISSPLAPDVGSEQAEHKTAVAPGMQEIASVGSGQASGSPSTNSATSPLPHAQSKEEQAKEVLATLNDVPVDFYGKAQDQYGNPIQSAEIIGSIIYDNGRSNGVREIQTVTDAKGLFELHGGNGESLSVRLRKEGYTVSDSTKAGFKYSHFYPEVRHVPDPQRPAIIEMWKLQGAEKLVHFQTKIYVKRDGTPSAFDLQTGQIVESGGDIILSIESPASPNPTSQYEWKAKIQAVGGGTIAWNDAGLEKMLLAPEAGYEPEIIVGYQSGVKPWSSRFAGGFYFKSRNGAIYGKLGIGIVTDFVKNQSVPVTIGSYLNPAGSRNLELDPALVVEAQP